jgi:hypothetical protein
LIGVALVAVAMGLVELRRRAGVYHARAELFAGTEEYYTEQVERIPHTDPEYDSVARERAQYFGAMQRKYARAARLPWIYVPPDPPVPGESWWDRVIIRAITKRLKNIRSEGARTETIEMYENELRRVEDRLKRREQTARGNRPS